MSPELLVISTTYKTRVATQKPCKERLGSVIGQLKDRRIWNLLKVVRHVAAVQQIIYSVRHNSQEFFLAIVIRPNR